MKTITTLWESRMRLVLALQQAGPVLTSSFLVALLANALVPPALAVVLGEIVSSVEVTPTNVLSVILLPLVFFAGVLVLGQLAEAFIQPMEYLLVNRIDGVHRAKLSQMIAAVPTIEVLEQSNVQAMIREVEADPRNGFESTPGQGAAAQLHWLTGLIGIVISALILARYAWWLPLVVILPAAINSLLRDRQNVMITRLWQKAVAGELHADVWRKATVSIGPAKETRVFGLTSWMVNLMQKHIAAANSPLWRYINRIVIDEWSQFLLVMIGLIPAYVAVTLGVLNGATTLAIQTMILSAGAAVYRDLAANNTMHHIAGGAAILDTTEQLRDILHPSSRGGIASQSVPASQRNMATCPPRIVFDEVTFHYPQSNRLILDRLTLDISAGESLALVGLNGSGKSTMIKLLTGLYTPTSGRILIDGQDLAELNMAEWRARLAVIFQDFIHYPLSARENVSLDSAQNAASNLNLTTASSGVTNVIDQLPQGWDTPLSRSRAGGVDLSGGQWQQIALARALHGVYEGADLLVLDEPTAHLDVRTEAEVFGRLDDLRGEVGLILISHRLATIRNADRIVLLADGRIVESGTHDELMALNRQYHDMFSLQARRFGQGYDDRIEEGEWL
jgi:ABC-type multidrug transport system fused ATPase/permease subunit